MPKTDLVRGSLREGLKAKGRSRRQSAVRRAEAANGSRQIRNDLLPALKIESYLIDALGSHSRRLRKSDAAHVLIGGREATRHKPLGDRWPPKILLCGIDKKTLAAKRSTRRCIRRRRPVLLAAVTQKVRPIA
jgi:hypothetical protein